MSRNSSFQRRLEWNIGRNVSRKDPPMCKVSLHVWKAATAIFSQVVLRWSFFLLTGFNLTEMERFVRGKNCVTVPKDWISNQLLALCWALCALS